MSKETRETTVEHELLNIPIASEQSHTILITKTLTLTNFISGEVSHRLEKIDLLATYISGPLSLRQILNNGLVSRMGGSADTLNAKVKVTNGLVMIHPTQLRSLGIGTFLFDQVVRWAINFDPSLEVATIKAGSGDATKDNQARRNRFYANFGIRFSDNENIEDVIAGLSLPMRAKDLIPYDGWKSKLEVLTLDKSLRRMEDEHQMLREKNVELTRCIQAKERALERRDSSHRQYFKFYVCIIVALGLALAWKW